SFGHLMSGFKEQARTSASDTAKADTSESSGHLFISIAGRRTMLRYKPASFEDSHVRSSLPRPAVCSRATMHRPSFAPALAWRIASRFVESIVSKRRIVG